MSRHISVMLLALGMVPAMAAAGYDGAELYMANCSNCHGPYGEGDGAVAPELSVALQDLRYISQRNGGEFPRRVITEIVDGREMRRAHGPNGMPVWGAAFTSTEGSDDDARQRVRDKIEALVDYLQSIQLTAD